MATNATKVVAQNQATADLIFNLAKKEGFSDIQATALVANSIQESSLNPGIKNFNPSSRDDSVGLFQLNFQGGMGVDFARAKGISIADAKILATDPTENASFIIADAKRKGFGSTRTAEEANRFLVKRVIRPGDQENEIRKRTAIHRQVEAELIRDPRAFGVNEESVATNTNDPDKFPDTRSNLHDPNIGTGDEGFRTTTIIDPVTGEETVVFNGKFQRGEERVPIGQSDQRGIRDGDDSGFAGSKFKKIKETDIITKPNILADLPISTYKATLYLLDGQEVEFMMNSPSSSGGNIPGLKILETGGRPGGEAAGGGASRDAFPLDYYIDDIELGEVFSRESRSPSNVYNIKFKIIEPYGFKFLTELRDACKEKGLTNFGKQHYVLSIEFQGYDDEGNQITTSDLSSTKKVIPFVFTKITTTFEGGSPEYQCEGVPTATVGLYSRYATIPFNIENTGQTLEDLFNSDAVDLRQGSPKVDGRENVTTSTESDPVIVSNEARLKVVERFLADDTAKRGALTPSERKTFEDEQTSINLRLKRIRSTVTTKADVAAPETSASGTPSTNQVISKGIVRALNDHNKTLVADTEGAIADRYHVIFEGGIGEANIDSDTGFGTVKVKDLKPMQDADVNVTNNNEQHQVQNEREIKTISAGQQMQSLIDQLIRSSEYITGQSNMLKNKAGKYEAVDGQKEPLTWYKISCRTVPIEFDTVRNRYAYDITYIVTPRLIIDSKSSFFKNRGFKGVHKKYDYWFKGKNTEVLNYEQKLDTLFYVIMTDMERDTKENALGKDLTKEVSTETEASSQGGAETKAGEPGAEAAANLYSPADFATAKIEILGDPDFIQQNEILHDPSFTKPGPFLEEDGSINWDFGETLIEINFKTMTDYNDETGLANIIPIKVKSEEEIAETGTTGLIYQIIKCVASFSQGVFSITLDGVIEEFAHREEIQAQRQTKAVTSTETDRTKPLAGSANNLPLKNFEEQDNINEAKRKQLFLNPQGGPVGTGGGNQKAAKIQRATLEDLGATGKGDIVKKLNEKGFTLDGTGGNQVNKQRTDAFLKSIKNPDDDGVPFKNFGKEVGERRKQSIDNIVNAGKAKRTLRDAKRRGKVIPGTGGLRFQ